MTATRTERVFRLPDLGEGLTEAEILSWRVAVGDTVEVDQSVVEVETAKAAVDVPSPIAGTVVALHGEPGTVVDVGAPLLSVAVPDERYREEERAGSGNVLIGYGTGERRRSRRRAARAAHLAHASREPRPAAEPGPAAPGSPSSEAPSGPEGFAPAPSGSGRADAPSGPAPERTEAPRVISPVVRRLARDHGLDVARVPATGPGGIVLRRDVDAAIAAAVAPAAGDRSAVAVGRAAPDAEAGDRAAVAGGRTAASAPATEDRAAGPADNGVGRHGGRNEPDAAEPVRIPLRGMRRAVADKLARSRREIPDATTWVDVDATPLVELKDEIKAACPDAGVGILALLARICVAGLRRYPELNAQVDTEREEIVRLPWVNLGFAAQTDRGLVVPVVHDAHRLTLAELAARLRDLTGRAREGTLAPEDLTGGTFTLNNYGVFGVDGSTPIINHPEAGLLGVGRIVDRPWGVDGELLLRKVAQLSFTFDHRVCDGGVAGGFLRFVADCVERPQVLITNL